MWPAIYQKQVVAWSENQTKDFDVLQKKIL